MFVNAILLYSLCIYADVCWRERERENARVAQMETEFASARPEIKNEAVRQLCVCSELLDALSFIWRGMLNS